MTILNIDHVELAIPAGREDDARAFYSGVLGLPETPKPAALARRGGAWFEKGAVRVHVGIEADFRPARKAHVAFVVDEFDELISRLAAAGSEVVPGETLGGRRRVHALDPFGNRLEFMETSSR